MPKQKRILKRKTTKRQINHKNKPKNISQELINDLFDKDITNIPPHLLDKIPAGASLRPTAATIRQMAMQQIAPMYNPMPIVPQQQQAANLRNANDLREKAIHQAKQDIQLENERKRELARQDSDLKRETKRAEHAMAMEKQEMNQAVKTEETRNKLEREKKELEYKKEELSKENELSSLAMQVDEIKAINRQFEHIIGKLKQDSKIDEKRHKLNTVIQRNHELKNECDALMHTICSFDESKMKKKYKKLYEDNAKLQSEAIILEQIKNNKQQAFIKSLENAAYTDIDYNVKFNTNFNRLRLAQAELAKQISKQEDIERKTKRLKFLSIKNEDIWQQQQEKELEATRLEEILKNSKSSLPVDTMIQTTTKEISNKQKQREIDNNLKLQKQIVEEKILNATQKHIASDDYGKRAKSISDLEQSIRVSETNNKIAEKSVKLYVQAKQKQLDNEALKTANNAYISGEDPAAKLMNMVTDEWKLQDRNAAFKVAGDEAERLKQALDLYRRKHQKIIGMFSAKSPQGELFRQFVTKYNIKLDEMGPKELDDIEESFKEELSKQRFDIDLD